MRNIARVLLILILPLLLSGTASAGDVPTWEAGERIAVRFICMDAESMDRMLEHRGSEKEWFQQAEMELIGRTCALGLFSGDLLEHQKNIDGFAGPGEVWVFGEPGSTLHILISPKGLEGA